MSAQPEHTTEPPGLVKENWLTAPIAGAPAALPLFGGTLLLDPGSLILSLPAAVSAGAATVSLPVPGTLPPGLEVRAQAFAPDPAVPGFVALSNGLHLALCP